MSWRSRATWIAIAGALTSVLGCAAEAETSEPRKPESTTAIATTGTAPPVPEPETPTVTVDRPALVMPVPTGWTSRPLADLRAELVSDAREAAPAVREILLDLVEQIDRGQNVGVLDGPASAPGPTPSVWISVERGDSSLTAAADRRIRYLQDVDDPDLAWVTRDRGAVTLPVGRAVRVVAEQDPPESHGVPARSIEYVLLLDGRTVSIAGTAPAAYVEFDDVMADLAASMSRPGR